MTDRGVDGDEAENIFPARIRTLRKRLGLTARELEQRAGLTKGSVGRIERGTRRVYASDLFRIALVTGRDISDLCSPADSDHESPRSLAQAEQERLLEAYGRIGDTRLRRDVFELIEALAASDTPKTV